MYSTPIGREYGVMTSGNSSLVLDMPRKALIITHNMQNSFRLEHSAALMAPHCSI